MQAIDDLQRRHFLVRAGVEPPSVYVAWALDRLERDEDEGDVDVALLAGASPKDEIQPLVQSILRSHGAPQGEDDQLAAGKYVAELRRRYLDGQETYATINAKLDRLYIGLGYPSWLTMLSRNCEYATDVPAFRELFEAEFVYVASLRAAARSTAEFLERYDRNISNSHDLC